MSLAERLAQMLAENHPMYVPGPVSLSRVPGGDINEAFRLDEPSGRYFVKTNTADFAYDMFSCEAKGLALLHQMGGASCPKPIQTYRWPDQSGLILQWIDRGPAGKHGWEEFAVQLAQLHRTSQPGFGLDYDNYIGTIKQTNTPSRDWMEFYYDRRITPQIRLAVDNGLLAPTTFSLVEKSFTGISGDIPKESPSLLHGDLWRGNLIFDDRGSPVFIDPAVYYGHREMDIAMMDLFGGFEAGKGPYQDHFPLLPQWQDRQRFYQLYYILVHVNLFGGHYVHSAMDILRYYGDRSQ